MKHIISFSGIASGKYRGKGPSNKVIIPSPVALLIFLARNSRKHAVIEFILNFTKMFLKILGN